MKIYYARETYRNQSLCWSISVKFWGMNFCFSCLTWCASPISSLQLSIIQNRRPSLWSIWFHHIKLCIWICKPSALSLSLNHRHWVQDSATDASDLNFFVQNASEVLRAKKEHAASWPWGFLAMAVKPLVLGGTTTSYGIVCFRKGCLGSDHQVVDAITGKEIFWSCSHILGRSCDFFLMFFC